MRIPTKRAAEGAAAAVAVTKLNYGFTTDLSQKLNKVVPIQVIQNDRPMPGPK